MLNHPRDKHRIVPQEEPAGLTLDHAWRLLWLHCHIIACTAKAIAVRIDNTHTACRVVIHVGMLSIVGVLTDRQVGFGDGVAAYILATI